MIQRELRVPGSDAHDPARLKRELMDVLRGHFRPEFINRIDEIIVFHALGKPEIRAIVELQLERVKRTANGQGIELAIDGSLVDHFASQGFQPEYGARELRRLIRSELETSLARAMRVNELQEGQRVVARWDAVQQRLVLEQLKKQDDSEAERAKSVPEHKKKSPADGAQRSAAE
jgi:ATP-dependent Clp protease ATP-binding subunit ClpC